MLKPRISSSLKFVWNKKNSAFGFPSGKSLFDDMYIAFLNVTWKLFLKLSIFSKAHWNRAYDSRGQKHILERLRNLHLKFLLLSQCIITHYRTTIYQSKLKKKICTFLAVSFVMKAVMWTKLSCGNYSDRVGSVTEIPGLGQAPPCSKRL